MKESELITETAILEIHEFLKSLSAPPKDLTIIGASKKQPIPKIQAAIDLGIDNFGENFLQEALTKIDSFPNCNWHFIGSIQSNKCKQISSSFNWVHTVERMKIGEKLNLYRPKGLGKLNICVQINLDDEDTKSGIKIEEAEDMIYGLSKLENIKVRGLMTIPKKQEEIEEQNKAFKKMNDHFIYLKKIFPYLDTLSMGMSHDYKEAIKNGSNMIRIGTKLFGERK